MSETFFKGAAMLVLSGLILARCTSGAEVLIPVLFTVGAIVVFWHLLRGMS